ncbi:PAS domain-containing protein [Pyxidicoccus fallax]|uniref:PAS domain-containing protein n=1 Tax=Pyxidicoccus fallax TaxID=394095 RepID=A0A848LZS6_9BACT|nr:PAS domain-containing protein [Pyxidicoccus fallax]NMO23032.1 PAS domain-containing protein [Pyxidicoccus fallax]NPC85584.1 PAS domain-containing protein [Pyxidicoccus fallax]
MVKQLDGGGGAEVLEFPRQESLLDADSLTGERLKGMSPEEFDRLPFGAIKLDGEGRVVAYNAAEAALARRERKATLGRRFFEEIAPCTNTASFRGRLDALVERGGEATERFDFKFLFPWGARDVRIRLMVLRDGSRWVFVTALNRSL